MKKKRLVLCMIVVGMATLPATTPVVAGIVINATETKSGVVFEGGGTLDLTLWTFDFTGNDGARVIPDTLMLVGPGGDIDVYGPPVNFAGPTSIGPGEGAVTKVVTGDLFGISWAEMKLGVPPGYVSGDPLNGSATYSGHTFASLGVEEGSYTWTWDTADGRGDFFTINIVPAPGALFLLGVAGFTHRRRRS